MKRVVVWVLDLAGWGLVTAAAWTVTPPAGLTVGGLGLLLIAMILDGGRPGRRR